MPRQQRLLNPSQPTTYHCISRSTLPGLPMGDIVKETLVQMIQQFSRLYFVEILGYTVMDTHFHIVARMLPEKDFSDKDIIDRYESFWGDLSEFSEDWIPGLRKKWANLSEFMKDIKQTFSRFYNKRHNHKGTFWSERFKSIIVEDGTTLINCLAYIDLNPVRAGIVTIPENYRWCSLGYHVQTENAGGFLSLDFGLKEFGELDDEARLRRYREYVYETGAVDKTGSGKSIDMNILEKERRSDFELSRIRKFRFRARHFSDSWVIGSKAFVSTNFEKFKDSFYSKKEKTPNPVAGLKGIYTLKKLME